MFMGCVCFCLRGSMFLVVVCLSVCVYSIYASICVYVMSVLMNVNICEYMYLCAYTAMFTQCNIHVYFDTDFSFLFCRVFDAYFAAIFMAHFLGGIRPNAECVEYTPKK